MKEYIKFFKGIFWLSVLLVTLGILINSETSGLGGQTRKYLEVFSELLKNIGVALFVANAFSFIIGTEEFVNFINKKLREIIVSNDFVRELDQSSKEKLAKLIFGPSKEIGTIYSKLEAYFDNYLNDSFQLFKLIYRDRVNIHVKAKFDEETQRVYFIEELDYKSFRVDGKMAKLRYSFESDDSKHIETKVTTPEGITYEIGEETEKDNINEKDPAMKVKKIQTLPDEFKKFDYLEVRRKFIEYGKDHWGVFSYKASQPSDGLRLRLECLDGLTVKYINTYGNPKNFEIERDNEEETREITVICHNWLTPGFGVMAIVSKENLILTTGSTRTPQTARVR